MKMLNFNLAIVLFVILMAIFSKNFTSNYSSCFIMKRRNDEERDRLWQLMQWQLRGLRVENLLLVIRFISIRSPFSIFASHLSHVIDARTLRRVWSILFNSLSWWHGFFAVLLVLFQFRSLPCMETKWPQKKNSTIWIFDSIQKCSAVDWT